MKRPPRLARGVIITRRRISDEEIFYLVREPGTGSFLKVGEAEATVLKLLDGVRTEELVAAAASEALGSGIEPGIVRDFVASMARRGVVETRDFVPKAFGDEWAARDRARRNTLGRTLAALTQLKLHLFNPDTTLRRLAASLGFLYTPGFVIASMVLMAAGGLLAVSEWEAILRSAGAFFQTTTSSLGGFAEGAAVLYGSFFLIVAIHELAHGLTCAHFGGKVTDMGFILFYLHMPGFYCDITDAYSFEKRSQRLWATVAGGYSGLVLAAAGVFLWWGTTPGDLLNNIAIALMFIGGPPLLILNWNPLMRLDGYYILMDLLEAPNLMANSFRYIATQFKTKILRVPGVEMVVPRRLRPVYLIYGISAFCFIGPFLVTMPYIIFYMLSLVLGEMLATIVATWMGLKMVQRYATSAFSVLRFTWMTHRPAVAAALSQRGAARGGWIAGSAAVALLILFVAFGPKIAVRAYGEGTLEPAERAEVRTMPGGFVTEAALSVMAREGDRVERNGVLMRLSNPELQRERDAAVHALDGARLQRVMAEGRGDPAEAGLRRAEERASRERLETSNLMLARLDLTSQIAGSVLTPALERRSGMWLAPGDLWCEVGRVDRLRSRLLLNERDLGLVEEGSAAAARVASLPGLTLHGSVVRMPAGRPEPMGSPGVLQAGAAPALDLDLDPLAPQPAGSFEVVVEFDNPSGHLRPGMTATVRLYGERLTLAGHAVRWVRRFYKGKVWW